MKKFPCISRFSPVSYTHLDVYKRQVSTWALSVENNSQDHEVVEVLFPYIRGVQVGAEPEDGVLVFPHHAGERIENPAKSLASDRYTGFWRAASRRERDGTYSRELNYCCLLYTSQQSCANVGK